MPRRVRQYVVQHHEGYGPEHWDLMIEQDGVLLTWRLERHPETLTDGPIPATRIADHRTAYLTYEGPVSGGRGRVRIVDAGTVDMVRYDHDALRLVFAGRVLAGRCTLTRVATDDDTWLLSEDA
jgi:hypothetical protein